MYDDDDDDESSPSPTEDDIAAPSKGQKQAKGKKTSKPKKDNSRAYQLTRDSDVVGVIFLEISSISDLPPERNGEHLASLLATVDIDFRSYKDWL